MTDSIIPGIWGETDLGRLSVERKRSGEYKVPPGTVLWTCFFIEEADTWRDEAWTMIKAHPDVRFFVVTKRVSRMARGLPVDWEGGYENVMIYCTAESRRQVESGCRPSY